MKNFNIMFTGVGGTGVLTAARMLATAALIEGNKVRMGEIHGMAQRGGAVNCTIRIGEEVYGPIISTGQADVLLSGEPVEALRQVSCIKPSGTIIVGENRIIPTAVLLGHAEYPNDETILQDLSRFARVITFNAVELAEEAGSLMVLNTILIGAAIGLDVLPVKEPSIVSAIKEILPKRYHQMNIDALNKGISAPKRAVTSAE